MRFVSKEEQESRAPLWQVTEEVLLPVAFFQICLYFMFTGQVQSWVRKQMATLTQL